eukprot:674267_1
MFNHVHVVSMTFLSHITKLIALLVVLTIMTYTCIMPSIDKQSAPSSTSMTDLLPAQSNKVPPFYDMFGDTNRSTSVARNRNHLYTNQDRQFMYCFIQKNANTMFRNLWFAVRRNDPFIYHIDTRRNQSDPTEPFHHHLHIYFLNNKQILNTKYSSYVRKVMQHSWTKIVIIRDPLERVRNLLSAFLDRCLWLFETYGVERECLGEVTNDFSFNDFVNRIINKTQHKEYITNPHFWPQSWFCELQKYVQNYEFVMHYDYDTIGAQTLQLLTHLNLSEYYYHWGPHYNRTMFEDTVHVTYRGGHNLQSQVLWYKQYYTKTLAIKCIQLYAKDYELFHLQYPQWMYHL